MIKVEEVIEALEAIAEGHLVQPCDGYIVVRNPKRGQENLVVDLQKLSYVLRNSQLIHVEKLVSAG